MAVLVKNVIKKPFFLHIIIIEVIFFLKNYLNLHYRPLSLQTYTAENVCVTNNIIKY